MPGARTHWHRHPLSQTVFVTEGIGLWQRRGGPVEVIRPGERVLFGAGEEHWQARRRPGAPDGPLCHKRGRRPDDAVEWLQPVTDEQYGQAL
ncbi:cupin domain-containing protein [Gordonia terrae]